MLADIPRLLTRPGHTPPAGEPIPVDPSTLTAVPTPVEARHHPDQAAAALALLEPTPAGHAALDALPAPALSDGALIDALVAAQKQLAALESKQVEFLAEIAHRDPRGEKFARDEVACALHLAPAVAGAKLEAAEQLVDRLSDTLDLVRGGHLSYANARILAAATTPRTDAVTARVQERVLPRGCTQTPGEFRAAVRRAIARLDPATETQRHEDAVTARKVVHYPDTDAMADIWLHLAVDGAGIVMTAINAWATKTGDTRTVDQRRADAIVDICQAALAMPGLPRQHGARPAVNITLAATTLAGLDEQPGELDGYGPIPASIARKWAADPAATRHYWLVDNEGRILDRTIPCQPNHPDNGLSSPNYVPPVSLARHVITRDQYCTTPGCRRQARHCHLDHRTPWPHGPTNAENLGPLCRRHHRMKHSPGWNVTKQPDGTHVWTSPTRHTYRYHPPEHPAPAPEPVPAVEQDDEPPPY